MTRAGDRSVMPTYVRSPLTLVRGSGTRVWDGDGRAYLDFAGGLGVTAIGHSHPAALSAAAEPTGVVAEVRGRGCLVGIQLVGPIADDAALGMSERGVPASTAGPDIVRMSPPLVATDADVDEAAAAFGTALGAVTGAAA